MWTELTATTLLSRVAGAEKTALERAALADGQSAVLAEIAALIAAEWRSGLRRVTVLDSRPAHVPSELLVHILAHFRYAAYTRLPGMAALLDDRRVAEWTRANQVRDSLARVSIEAPDAAYAETSSTSGKPGPAIAEPDAATVL